MALYCYNSLHLACPKCSPQLQSHNSKHCKGSILPFQHQSGIYRSKRTCHSLFSRTVFSHHSSRYKFRCHRAVALLAEQMEATIELDLHDGTNPSSQNIPRELRDILHELPWRHGEKGRQILRTGQEPRTKPSGRRRRSW